MMRLAAFLALCGAAMGCSSHQGAVRPAGLSAPNLPVDTGDEWATLTVQTGEASVRLADRWIRLYSGSEPMKGVPVRAAVTIPVGSRVQLTFPSSRPGLEVVGELPDAGDGFMDLLAGLGGGRGAAPVASGSAIVVAIEGPARLKIGGDPDQPFEGILSVARAQKVWLKSGRGSDSFHVRLGDRILLRTAPGGTDLVASRDGGRMSMVNLGKRPVVFLTGSRAEDMITVSSGETISVPVSTTSGPLQPPERRWIGALAVESSADTALELQGTRGRLTAVLEVPVVARVSGTAIGLDPGQPWVIESWVVWQ